MQNKGTVRLLTLAVNVDGGIDNNSHVMRTRLALCIRTGQEAVRHPADDVSQS